MEWLFRIGDPWASLFNESPLLQTAMLFAHLAGMLVGGGFAIAADRATLRAVRFETEARSRQLAELRSVHRPVLAALAVTMASGLLLLLADLETYLGSAAFWTKMLLLAALLGNGYRVQKVGSDSTEDTESLWSRLRVASLASIALWLAVVLAGTVLTST